jgi:hypothetical protein
MKPYCRHRAEKALEIYWQRPVSIKESATLVTALMNTQASSSHQFLMKNIEMHMAQAQKIYEAHAPYTCHCDEERMENPMAA